MAKLAEILDIEKKRTDPLSLRQIHLWAEGSFYRAYEWSAWLCVRYIRQFKVTRKSIKNLGSDMLFIGFPQTSLDKFKVDGAQVEEKEDKNVQMTLPPELVQGDADSTLEEEYQNWRTTIPLLEEKDTKADKGILRAASGHVGQPVSLTGIMRQVLEYPIEQHSPIDCMLFLAEIKVGLSSLL